ncbi:hypothetical protein F5Y14DRAFT_445507 [Nemania sp. NC0429]|nr:hypothetical protein F5Y14DRAFT_445507 [Nemania sp. NC0429]
MVNLQGCYFEYINTTILATRDPKFTYDATNDKVSGFSTVTSPAGLLEWLQYDQYGHRLPNGALVTTIPYVALHTIYPGQGQPAIETSYQFSDYNFLGYGEGIGWRNGEDNLFLVPDEYQYTSTVKMKGGSTTKHTYNKFHLVVESQKQKGTKRVTQSIEYYALKHSPFDDQPAQYQLPRTVTTTFKDTVSNKSRSQVTQHSYDKWGNPTKEAAPNGIVTERVYYTAAGEKDAATGDVLCPADPHGFQRYVKKVATTPATSPFTTPTRSEEYTYRELPAATGGYTTHSVVVKKVQSLEDGECHFSTQYSFINKPTSRDHSRLQQETKRIAERYPTIRTIMYQYPSSDKMTETVATKSFDELGFEEKSTKSLLTGVMTARQDPRGVKSTFEYNRIGRLVKETVAPGTDHEAVRRYEHAVITRDDGRTDGICVTRRDAKGVQQRHITDGLDRVCRVENQDDDGEWARKDGYLTYSGTFRRVEVDEVDRLRNGSSGKGLKSGSGVVTYTDANPITLTTTEGIEGEGKAVTEVNLSDDSLYSKAKWAYDGLGRTIQQRNPLDNISEFRYEWSDRITRTIPPGKHRAIHTQYADHSAAEMPTSINVEGFDAIAKQWFDGLSRIQKLTVGGRTTAQSYEDCNPSPAKVTTPTGTTYKLALSTPEYECSCDYDVRTADTTQRKNDYMTRSLKYSSAGLVTAESFQRKTEQQQQQHASSTENSSFAYSIAGRLEVYTEVHGQTPEMQYDSFGRPQKLTQGKVKVTFAYDKAGRQSETCVKDDDDANLTLTSRLSYDDFGREVERAVSKADGALLYKVAQTYNTVGLVEGRTQTDSKGVLLRGESFQYDDLNRPVDYQCQGSEGWLPTETGAHVLKRQRFTFDEYNCITKVSSDFQDGSANTATYTFSSQDPTQVVGLTNTHKDYTAKLDFSYDANGCLVNDGQGHLMEYGSTNRLRVVKDVASQAILSLYKYDADGRLVCQSVPGKPDVYFSYQDGKPIAVTAGDSQVSYLSDGTAYWGQTTSAKGETAQERRVWSSDGHGSVQAYLDSSQSTVVKHQQYAPYGHVGGSGGGSGNFISIGYNGEWRDPVTGWYHFGNGYRVYNPVFMRFHSPDVLSPFGSGEINGYAYCLGDPINQIDPSDHFSIFGFEISFRNLVIAAVGAGIAAGIVSDVAAGAAYDLATGKTPTWESIGTDALYGAIGGVVGEGLARGFGMALKAGARRLGRGIDQLLEGGAKLRMAAPHDPSLLPLEKLERALASYREDAWRRPSPTSRAGIVRDIRAREPWGWHTVTNIDRHVAINRRVPETHLYWRPPRLGAGWVTLTSKGCMVGHVLSKAKG